MFPLQQNHYLHTYSMEQSPKNQQTTNFIQHSPSREADSFSDSQEIPRILWNQKIHSPIPKSPPPVPILSHINQVYVAYLTSRRPILILYFHSRLCLTSGLFLSGFPTKSFIHLSVPHACYIPYQSYSSLCDYPNNT